MNDLLTEYYDSMISRIEAMDGSVPPGKKALEEFWNEIDLFLPPKGQLVLARSEDGTLFGCGTLKSIGSTSGESKRLFVRPEARGFGLSRRLIEMRGLYKKLGFKEIDGYADSASLKLHPNLKGILCNYSTHL